VLLVVLSSWNTWYSDHLPALKASDRIGPSVGVLPGSHVPARSHGSHRRPRSIGEDDCTDDPREDLDDLDEEDDDSSEDAQGETGHRPVYLVALDDVFAWSELKGNRALFLTLRHFRC
jgi:hypothetical protein